MSPAKPRKTTRKQASDTATDREVSLAGGSENADAAAPGSSASAATGESSDGLEERIRNRAYELYCERNAGDGNAMEDWLAAEREIRFGRASTEGRAPALLDSLNTNRASRDENVVG
jgi:hypothetical protein